MVSANTSLKTVFEQHADAIEEITNGLTEEQASKKPAENEWSIREVLTHLLGSEQRSFEDGLKAFLKDDALLDQTPGDPYITESREKLSTADLTAEVAKQYRQIGEFIGGLSAEQMQRTAHIPMLKDYGINDHPSLEMWAGIVANMHLRGHVEQMRANLK